MTTMNESLLALGPDPVHEWRVWQLTRLGVPFSLAQAAAANRVDWHQVARLVQHGCPPRLALRIVL
jgi:hypothetical protein